MAALDIGKIFLIKLIQCWSKKYFNLWQHFYSVLALETPEVHIKLYVYDVNPVS